LFLGSITVGILGFMIIEDFSFLDAFYMTLITFSTVGFTEVHPLSPTGRLFTGIYIILNLGIFAYIVSVISAYLFEGELRKIFRNFLIGKDVKKMKNHIIVCGFGRTGARACEELFTEKIDFLVIEKNIEKVSLDNRSKNFQFIKGDATQDDVLLEAGIERASTVITALPKDTDNVFITLTAKEMNPRVKVIARATDENSEKKLHRAGASYVVMPYTLGGMHMANLITKPYVIEFLELLNGVGDVKVNLEEVSREALSKEYHGKTLKEMDIRQKTGATIIAIKNGKRGFQFNPHADKVIDDDDVMIVLGTDDCITKFRKEFTD
ncbi:MAG: NAD-binding protein, partial [Bacteroidota bacterium]